MLAERFIAWSLHAALFRAFGPAAFVVADVLITLAWYALMSRLLSLAGVSELLGRTAAAVLACSATGDFGEFFSKLRDFPILFWGLRIPRPFVSELFLLAAMGAALEALRDLPRPRVTAWVTIGAAGSLLAQSDFYSALGLALGLLGVLVVRFVPASTEQRRALGLGLAISLGVAIALALHVIAQSLLVHPDSLVRQGMIPASRLEPPLVPGRRWYLHFPLALAGLGWAIATVRRARGVRGEAPARNARLLALSAYLGALFALPAMAILMGRVIQIYHFQGALIRAFSLAGLIVGLQGLELAWAAGARRLGARAAHFARWLVLAPAAASCLYFAWVGATRLPARTSHMRTDYAEWRALPDYRRGFIALTRELSRPAYADRLVLGTFDHQLWSWWLTFAARYSYLPDACTSNVPDAEIERRLIAFARVLGMTSDEFVALVRRPYVGVFWLGCGKYQASRLYTFAPLPDYAVEDQARIARTEIFKNFSLSLPTSEQARLRRGFEAAAPSPDRLDLIVLTRDASVADFVPAPGAFVLAYENPVFRVWTRRDVP